MTPLFFFPFNKTLQIEENTYKKRKKIVPFRQLKFIRERDRCAQIFHLDENN